MDEQDKNLPDQGNDTPSTPASNDQLTPQGCLKILVCGALFVTALHGFAAIGRMFSRHSATPEVTAPTPVLATQKPEYVETKSECIKRVEKEIIEAEGWKELSRADVVRYHNKFVEECGPDNQ